MILTNPLWERMLSVYRKHPALPPVDFGALHHRDMNGRRPECDALNVNLPISVRTDSINKGSKIICASLVDGNSLRTITDPKAMMKRQNRDAW